MNVKTTQGVQTCALLHGEKDGSLAMKENLE